MARLEQSCATAQSIPTGAAGQTYQVRSAAPCSAVGLEVQTGGLHRETLIGEWPPKPNRPAGLTQMGVR